MWPLAPSVAPRPRSLGVSRPSGHLAERQTRLHRDLVKDHGFREPGRLPSTSAPSACLREASKGARHRSHDFAAASRLPTPVRPSARERLDPPLLGGRPGAARRLLQSKQSTSTTAGLDRPNPGCTRRGASIATPALKGGRRSRDPLCSDDHTRADHGATKAAPPSTRASLRLTRRPGGVAPSHSAHPGRLRAHRRALE